MILKKIVASKKVSLRQEKKELPIEKLVRLLEKQDNTIKVDFEKALRNSELAIIAEIKKASPSKGIIREDFDVAKIAAEYKRVEASAVSVLTEKEYFLGDVSYLNVVKKACDLPVLRKDFIIDEWQIFQSKLLSADAILLIARILTQKELENFLNISKDLGIDCLVEVVNESEIESALKAGADIIGINNRNLESFIVDIKTTEKLVRHIPKNVAIVSESGIDIENIREIKNMGVNAILVGEAIMRQTDCYLAVKKLREAASDKN